MVSFRRLSEDGEVAIVPVETACIGNYSANACTMSAYPFGCRFNNDVCTKVNWATEIAACSEGVVDDERDIMFPCQFCKSIKIGDVESGISNRLNIRLLLSFCLLVFQRMPDQDLSRTLLQCQSLQR